MGCLTGPGGRSGWCGLVVRSIFPPGLQSTSGVRFWVVGRSSLMLSTIMPVCRNTVPCLAAISREWPCLSLCLAEVRIGPTIVLPGGVMQRPGTAGHVLCATVGDPRCCGVSGLGCRRWLQAEGPPDAAGGLISKAIDVEVRNGPSPCSGSPLIFGCPQILLEDHPRAAGSSLPRPSASRSASAHPHVSGVTAIEVMEDYFGEGSHPRVRGVTGGVGGIGGGIRLGSIPAPGWPSPPFSWLGLRPFRSFPHLRGCVLHCGGLLDGITRLSSLGRTC